MPLAWLYSAMSSALSVKYFLMRSIFMNCSIISGVQNFTLFVSMVMLRLMRRPSLSDIPLQLVNWLVTIEDVGMVVMVLSKFRTLTVVRLISVTVPSALSMVIQSPMRSISLMVSWMLPTKPRMMFWKINRSTADMVPSPMMTVLRLLPKRKEMINRMQMAMRMILMVCTKPVKGLILAVWCML